ncbi:hypothetical protein Sste5346_008440 [Sporothrix stenoceras]|uniref:Uncharacterized protein n=1 Tax=Sporothrix stenoceras TaxID=5173 RepID=A0ABR3YPX4_9PEZI
MPRLLSRDAGAASGGAGVSLGVIIAVVIIGTIFVAVGGGLLCTWAARRKRHKRRQSRRAEEEEARKKQMMAVTMMRDSDEGTWPVDGHQTMAGDVTSKAAATAATNYFRPGGAPISDCASSTCCSLASTRDSFSTMDGDFEGSGVTWWWLWRWRRFWHNQRRWVRRQKQRGTAVLGRTGSNSSGSSSEIKLQSQHNHCQHDHGHHGHHHHRRGTVDGSPRKLRRHHGRPETSVIASTNSLFFSAFVGENDNNRDAIASNAANGEIGLREAPPSFSIIRANSNLLPQRPPPPSEQQRLIQNGSGSVNQSPPKMGGANGPGNGVCAAGSVNNIIGNRSSMPNPNMPPRPQNPRYRPRSGPPGPGCPQQAPSLQPPPPISTRSLPRPPQPALIIPSQPDTYIPPGVPFHPNLPPHQQHQMMIMMMQQQQMQLQQQIRQQHMQQQHQGQQRLSRSGSKHGPQQNYATEAALTEILRSTEQRLAQLQGQQPGGNNLGSMKRASMTSPAKTNSVAAPTPAGDTDAESIKRISQTSGSDADSMSMANNSKDVRDSSPILDAIPTALSSPSKSPNKNRVAAGTLSHAGGNNNNVMMAHPMMLPAVPPPAVLLPVPGPSSVSNSSPETRSPSSVYSSSGASSRSSLSTVYSVDERSDKGTVTTSKATSKGGVRIANSDDDAQNDRILAGLGITGALAAADAQFVDISKKSLEDVHIAHAVVEDSTLIPAALSTPKSKSRASATSAAPNLPARSPKRSAGTVTKGSGIMIPHSASSNSLSSSNSASNVNNTRGPGPGPNRNRHRRNGSVWQQAPSPQQLQQYGVMNGNNMNTNNMMHNNSARFTFGGPNNNKNTNNNNNQSVNSGVRLMVTCPSKPDVNDTNNSSDADLSDEKTPTSVNSSSSPNAWRKSADRSLLCSSPTLAPEDEHSLVPGRANPRTSWGNPNGHGALPPNPPKHGRRSLNERIEALHLQGVESEDTQFRRAVRPLPRPPSFGSLNNLNALNALSASMAQNPHSSYSSQSSQTSQPSGTVVAAAAELRRMNSTAYSEASSCYSNATSAVGKSPALGSLQIATAPSAMGLAAQPRRAHRRRNSSAGESASGVSSSSNRNSAVGSRQYLALGKKRVSQVPSHVGGAYDKENRDVKRVSAPPTSSSSSAGRPWPQRTRSARSMTTTGTALRRVDENPASGASTPSGTPNKGTPNGALTPSATAGSNLSVVSSYSPSTPKANTGRPLRKSPSRSTQVGNTLLPATGSPVGKLRAKSMMGPSTPPAVRQLQQQHAANTATASRDSLGLYDQDGFLLSSPARKV